ncbi:MAG: hypothetical protein IH944_02550 [Armatimonadetes bacterium]|nr:hypothetical protein [Armatimonadota bacterium]
MARSFLIVAALLTVGWVAWLSEGMYRTAMIVRLDLVQELQDYVWTPAG